MDIKKRLEMNKHKQDFKTEGRLFTFYLACCASLANNHQITGKSKGIYKIQSILQSQAKTNGTRERLLDNTGL